jgi:hypothetical protein
MEKKESVFDRLFASTDAVARSYDSTLKESRIVLVSALVDVFQFRNKELELNRRLIEYDFKRTARKDFMKEGMAKDLMMVLFWEASVGRRFMISLFQESVSILASFDEEDNKSEGVLLSACDIFFDKLSSSADRCPL